MRWARLRGLTYLGHSIYKVSCIRFCFSALLGMQLRGVHVRQVPGDNQSVIAYERLARCSYALLAIGCEWYVCSSCVAAVERPFCFAVADDEDARVGHGGVSTILSCLNIAV